MKPGASERGSSRVAILVCLLLVTSVTAGFGQPAENTEPEGAGPADETVLLDQAIALALAESREIALASRAVADAADELGLGGFREGFSLAVAGAVSGTGADDIDTAGSARMSLDLTLLPQLTLSAGLGSSIANPPAAGGNDVLAANAGLSFDPFAQETDRARDELALQAAELELESLVRSVSSTAIARLLAAVSTKEELPLLEAEVHIAERSLASTQALFERDRATADQLAAARDTLRLAQQASERARLDLRLAISNLSRTVGVPILDQQLPSIELLDPEALVADLLEERSQISVDALVEQSLGSARLDLLEATLDREDTRRFDPDLTVGASVATELTSDGAEPRVAGPEYTLSFSFGFSPDDRNTQGVVRAEEDIRFAEESLESARVSATFALEIALLEFDQASENLEDAVLDRIEAEQDLVEGEFLLGRGEITELARDELVLDARQAAWKVTNAQLALVALWSDIQLLQFLD